MNEIRRVDAAHQADINLPNEPFRLFGPDTETYRHTRQEGKADILFCTECE